MKKKNTPFQRGYISGRKDERIVLLNEVKALKKEMQGLTSDFGVIDTELGKDEILNRRICYVEGIKDCIGIVGSKLGVIMSYTTKGRVSPLTTRKDKPYKSDISWINDQTDELTAKELELPPEKTTLNKKDGGRKQKYPFGIIPKTATEIEILRRPPLSKKDRAERDRRIEEIWNEP
jgi:hypothetical protein